MPQVFVKQSDRHSLESGGESTDLREDVYAVLLFFDHAVDSAGLALDSLQSGKVLLLVVDVSVLMVAVFRL